jgi:hypothetical protein
VEKQIRRMEIEPADNGGHTVQHSYKSQPVNRKGSMAGGMDMDYPKPESFVFGSGDGEKLVAHVVKHLGIKKAAAEEKAGEE